MLSSKDIGQLRTRGIEIEKDAHGSRYVFSLQGLYWLFNYLYEHGHQRLTEALLRTLANVPAGSEWRTLRVLSVELPTYGDDRYTQLAIYLNGSPPRLLVNTSAEKSIPREVSFHSMLPLLILRANELEICCRLSDEELERLGDGECLNVCTE
jgi:hypothetical protein